MDLSEVRRHSNDRIGSQSMNLESRFGQRCCGLLGSRFGFESDTERTTGSFPDFKQFNVLDIDVCLC